MSSIRQCLACSRLARADSDFCCEACARAWQHEHEILTGSRETVELQRDNGRHTWRGCRHLGLQNSA